MALYEGSIWAVRLVEKKAAADKAAKQKKDDADRGASPSQLQENNKAYQAELIKHHVETLRRLKFRPTGGFALFSFADGQITLLASRPSDRPIRYVLETGTKVPLHLGATGKCILANLPESQWDDPAWGLSKAEARALALKVAAQAQASGVALDYLVEALKSLKGRAP